MFGQPLLPLGCVWRCRPLFSDSFLKGTIHERSVVNYLSCGSIGEHIKMINRTCLRLSYHT